MIKTLLLALTIMQTLSAIEPIQPLPQKLHDVNYEKALLGKKLFMDPILSKDKSVSCNSCHNIKAGGADKRHVSVGIDNQ